MLFQSTHPVWGGTRIFTADDERAEISIHPPRVGWDLPVYPEFWAQMDFNPPTPCGVGLSGHPFFKVGFRFQSTHPVWGGTWNYRGWHCAGNFNPPTPCGVGRELTILETAGRIFQSTHPVWGGTFCPSCGATQEEDFNPPTPCGVGPQKFTKQAVELLRK